jgi:hypothetical protein
MQATMGTYVLHEHMFPCQVLAYSRQMNDEATSPITHELSLGCSVEHAFATYTGRIGEWWDPSYTASPETLQAVTIEPRAGGRVYATHSDLGEHDWGEVTVWEPGHRIVHTFTLAQAPQHPSEVSLEFVPDEGARCTLRFAHGGWTEANAEARKKFGDWPVMLDRFVALAD